MEGRQYSPWMYLDMSNPGRIQISDGNLVDLTDYQFVYDWRQSLVNQMQYNIRRTAKKMYDMYETPEISVFERYGLVDLYQMPRNAGPDELEVN